MLTRTRSYLWLSSSCISFTVLLDFQDIPYVFMTIWQHHIEAKCVTMANLEKLYTFVLKVIDLYLARMYSLRRPIILNILQHFFPFYSACALKRFTGLSANHNESNKIVTETHHEPRTKPYEVFVRQRLYWNISITEIK